jgi:hypothetical protein
MSLSTQLRVLVIMQSMIPLSTDMWWSVVSAACVTVMCCWLLVGASVLRVLQGRGPPVMAEPLA